MELKKAEAEGITKQIEEWLVNEDNELECTFGNGKVDATTFFQVAQRLRSKGLSELQQEDRLTISTPQKVRFTIQTIGTIQQYCKDDTLADKPFVAMIKESNMVDSTLDISDYDIRIKSRVETNIANDEKRILHMFANWPSQDKGFRLMRRWSFEEKGLRYDLSIVRSTASSNKGFQWQKKFTDQNIGGAPYIYEIEVELQRLEGDTVEIAKKRLIKGIGEVLRGIQKSSILIRKSNKKAIFESYKTFIKSDGFLGCKPVTLGQKNFGPPGVEPNIRTGYNVTDKADGLRCLGYCDADGELYLIDMGLNIYRTGLSSIKNRESIIDGEWVTRDNEKKPINLFLAFDIYYAVDKENISQLPFYNKDNEEESRHAHLKKWTETFNKSVVKLLPYLTFNTTLQVSIKTFLFGKENDLSIFKNASAVLNNSRIYYTDGLIFTSNTAPLPGYNKDTEIISPGVTFYQQFKWKPSEDNTVDFLVRFVKDPEDRRIDRITIGIKPETNETIRYKTMQLYVGSNKPKGFNPRDTILYERKTEAISTKYRPVPFVPKEYSDSYANTSYVIIQTDNATQEEYIATELNNEPIQDESIVEMRYSTDPSTSSGWRWIPMRIRHDKTEKLRKSGLGGTLNAEKIAEDIWNSIHEPITRSMITSGSLEASASETNATLAKINKTGKYFTERKAPANIKELVQGMHNFHNKFIKEKLLYNICLKAGGTLIDLACGKGSDITRWNKKKVSFVLGIDYSEDNIINVANGAYSRYIGIVEENKYEKYAPMVFVSGDCSKPLRDGTAGTNDQERDILRSIFGNSPMGPVPSLIDTKAGGLLKNGADSISCMLALHYFFENKESLNGLLRNINDTLKVGGYFFGCCFDGERVFDLLKHTPKGGTITGIEKKNILWNIRKDYDADELVPSEESIGMKINVDYISIGIAHDEYLVSFPYFIERMKEIGCELISDKDANPLGLKHGSDTFDNSYEMTPQFGKAYPMGDDVKKFSFLNRWFIFVKTQEITETLDMAIGDTLPIGIIKPKTKRLATVLEEATLENASAATEVPRVVVEEEDAATLLQDEEVKEDEASEQALRTIPVKPSSAAPEGKTYTLNEIYKFYFNAPLEDKLAIGDKEAARYISPQTPYLIPDFDDSTIVYSSIEHFMAGMVYKYGTNKPDLADTIFSRKGSIHQDFMRKRLLVSKGAQEEIPYDKDHELLNNELTAIKEALRPASIKKNKAVLNEPSFAVKKDELLRKAIEYRYKHDERMRTILEAARKKGKYLLYYTEGRTNANLGGVRKITGLIEGANKLGKIYMDLAGF